jgi:hypothetical protein
VTNPGSLPLRTITTLIILAGALALAGAASARDMTLPKMTPEALHAACDTAGGKFSQDSRGSGCGTDCLGKPGTACTVFCPANEKCTAQGLGGRRPHTVAEALTKSKRKH